MPAESPANSRILKLFGASSVPMEDEDALFMERVKAGDSQAFQALYGKYRRPIMSFLSTLVADPAVVDELFQETFLKVFRARATYEKRSKFSTYLWTIAKHTAWDWIEKKKESLAVSTEEENGGFPVIENTLEAEVSDAETALIEKMEEKAILDCIARLPEKDRLICSLRIHSEWSYEEIAAETGLPLGTLKTKLHRIREKLAKCFRAKGEGR